MHHTGKKEIKKKIKKNEVTKNFLQADSNPDHQNQLELKVNASIPPLDHLCKGRSIESKRGLYYFSMVIDSFQG